MFPLIASINKGNGCGQELKKKRQKPVDHKGCPFNKPAGLETLRDLSLVSQYHSTLTLLLLLVCVGCNTRY